MRRIAVVAAALVSALAVAGGAGATSAPPLHSLWPAVPFLPTVHLPTATRQPASCSAHARAKDGKVARFARKLAPVACEQPPRAKLRDAFSSVFAGP